MFMNFNLHTFVQSIGQFWINLKKCKRRGLVLDRWSRSAEGLESREMLTVFTVTTALDDSTADGFTSLREAIDFANTTGGVDEINFAPELSGQRMLLTQGQIEISDSLQITGLGSFDTVIDGQGNSRVFALTATAGDVTLVGLTVTAGATGNIGAHGGGIYSESAGTLSLVESTVSASSTAAPSAQGGGIFSVNGPVVLISSTVSENTTFGSFAPGGGIATDSAPITLINSTISGNVTRGTNSGGGGIATYDGNIRLVNTTVTLNATVESNSSGGGVFSGGTGNLQTNTVTINNSIVANNNAFAGTSEDVSINSGTFQLNVNNSLIGVDSGTGLTPAPVGSPDNGGNLIGTTAVPINPQLGALAPNGGTTRSHALLSNSPAINAGENSLALDTSNSPLTLDQAGQLRIFRSIVDMGSYERQSAGTSTPTVSFNTISQNASEGVGSFTLTVSLSALTNQAVTVPFSISGTATQSSDFTFSTSSPLTIPANTLSATFTISIVDDSITEGNESIVVALGTPTNATLGSTPTHTLTILDNDIASGAPTDITLSSNTVAENLANAVVGTLSAIDPDAGNTHTYAILAGGQGNLFTLSGNQLKVGTTGLNYESLTGGTAVVTIRATDNTGLTVDKTFTINVSDTNEAPTITAGQSFAVTQNAPVNSVVGTVSASDPDTSSQNNTLTYSITGGNTSNAFTINSSTGQITVNNSFALNSTTNPQFTLTIRIADNGSPSLSATQSINITVANSNVNQPPSINAGQVFSISDQVSNNSIVGTVIASDPDSSAPNNTLTYSIVGGNTAGAFAINTATGQISVANSSVLDATTTPQYTLQIRVADGGSPALTATQNVTVNVTELNSPPSIPAGQTFSISENAATNALVGTVTASDPDSSSPNNSLTYSIVGGNTANAFSIDASTGQIRVLTPSAIDFETSPTFSLQVRVTDGGSPSQSTTQTVTVTLNDLNEAPSIPANQDFTVSENATVNSVVGNVIATDPDLETSNNTLTYSIINGNTNNAFAINPSTGQLTVNNSAALNLSNGSVYTLSIRAVDSGSPSLSTIQTVRVQITEINQAPSIPGGQTFTISESAGANAVVGTVVATDPNVAAPSNTLTYSIVSGNANGAFVINPATGQIRVGNTSALDFETASQITLQVQATDAGSPPLSASQSVTILITDVNEPPLVPSGQSFNVGENAANNTSVGTVTASDQDANAPENTLIYSITGGNTNNAFSIDSSTGQISVANSSALNAAANPTFALQVMVADGGTPSRSTTTTVTISVADSNDAPSIPTGQVLTITEDSAVNTTVGVVTATDPDVSPPNNTLTYSIIGGNLNNAFSIDSSTGQIRVAQALDFETVQQYSLQVQVSDAGNPSLSAKGTVTVNVTNVNEAPVIPNSQAFSLLENSGMNTVIGTVSATDPDSTSPDNVLKYSITGGNVSNAITINPLTGQLTVNNSAAIDFETTPQLTLQVTATDGATPALATTQTVVITLNDVNEAPTVVANQNFSVIEGAPANTVVGTVSATDPDVTAENNTLTYNLLGGNTGEAFAIDPLTGQIKVNNPALLNSLTTPTYTLQVRASDGGGLFDIQAVTVTVTQQNAAPVLVNDGVTPEFVFRDRQPVAVVPGIQVSDVNGDSDIQKIIITVDIPPGRRNPDIISLGSASSIGTISDMTSNGRRQIQIVLNEGVTSAEVQTLLQSLTFSTKGRGLRMSQREFQIQAVDREGATSNVITQTVKVTRRIRRA